MNLVGILIILILVTSDVCRGVWSSKPILAPNPYHDNDQSYWIQADVHLLESGESFRIEEWAAGANGLYRLDVTKNPFGVRQTLVVNKATGEKFLYWPFSCFSTNSLDGPDIASKFPIGSELVPTGIGALWSHTERLNGTLQVGSPESIDKKFNKMFYSYVYEPTDEFKYRVELVFRLDPVTLNFERNPEYLAAVHLILKNDDVTNLDTSIRILKSQFPFQSEEVSLLSKFDLPLGYGCKPKSGYEHEQSPPIIGLDSSLPNVIDLDILLLLPGDLSDDFDKWKTHSLTLRIVRGQLLVGDDEVIQFASYERTDRAPEVDCPLIKGSKIRQSSLRQRKRIWNLGQVKQSESLVEYGKPAFYFDIDEQAGTCESFGERIFNRTASFEFPILYAANSSEQKNGVRMGGLVLDTQMLQLLFSSTEDFNLLGEEKATWSTSHVTYERQLKLLDLYNYQGELIWSGPASLVRQQEQMSNERIGGSLGPITAILYLFDDNREKLLTKIQLTYVDRRPLKQAYFHRELDLSTCMERKSTVSSLRGDKMRSYDFKIRFTPSNSEDTADVMDSDEELKDAIYSQFVRSLMDLSDGYLDVLQLTDIEVDLVESDEVLVSGRLLEKPYLLYFHRREDLRILGRKQGSFSSELKPDEMSCADTCKRYRCAAFSYCTSDRRCDLMLNTATDQPLRLIEERHCTCYTPHSSLSEDRGLEPVQFLHDLRLSLESNYEGKPLNLSVAFNGGSSKILLVADSLETNVVRLDQIAASLINELMGEVGSSGPVFGTTIDEPSDKDDLFRAEYEILYTNTRYKPELTGENFPIKLANHFTYQDCESLCAEIDCRSFSHCQIEQTCQVSLLYETESIEPLTEAVDFCTVLARDCLSEFSAPIQVSRPSLEQVDTRLWSAYKAESSRDCASSCSADKSKDFKCKSFYFCNNHNGASECLLTSDRRVHKLRGSNYEQGELECDFYTRSYLAEFVEFHRRSLPESSADTPVVIFGHNSADACAAECVEAAAFCGAFHVCTSPVGITCAIVKQSLDSFTRRPFRSSQFVDNQQCTGFLYTRRQQTSSALSYTNTDEEALIEGDLGVALAAPELNHHHQQQQQQCPADHQASSWWNSFCFVLVGLILGYAMAFAVRRHRQFR